MLVGMEGANNDLSAAPIPCGGTTASLEGSWDHRGSFNTIPGTSWVDAGRCASPTFNSMRHDVNGTEEEPLDEITANVEGTIESEGTQYYVVRVTNKLSGRTWTCQKRFSDFEHLEVQTRSITPLSVHLIPPSLRTNARALCGSDSANSAATASSSSSRTTGSSPRLQTCSPLPGSLSESGRAR